MRLKNKKDIEAWLSKMDIKDYYLDHNFHINVQGNVCLSDKNLEEIPVQFLHVSGFFTCSKNNLKTLKGCPSIVEEYFSCDQNNLTDLKYAPIKVGEDFWCSKNKLSNLESPLQYVGGEFFCNDNCIKTLKNFKALVKGNFYGDNNPIRNLNELTFDLYGKFRHSACLENKIKHFEHLYTQNKNNYRLVVDIQTIKSIVLSHKLEEKLLKNNQAAPKFKI